VHAENSTNLGTAPQMSGHMCCVWEQATKVDHVAQSRCSLAKVFRRFSVAPGEIMSGVHRVNQVVGHVDAANGTLQVFWLEQVAADHFNLIGPRPVGDALRVANQHPHGMDLS
jgi:hypothetical protein